MVGPVGPEPTPTGMRIPYASDANTAVKRSIEIAIARMKKEKRSASKVVKSET